MDESGIIEEEYSTAVAEKNKLSEEMEELRRAVSSKEEERENVDSKLQKVSENLKKVTQVLCFLEYRDCLMNAY